MAAAVGAVCTSGSAFIAVVGVGASCGAGPAVGEGMGAAVAVGTAVGVGVTVGTGTVVAGGGMGVGVDAAVAVFGRLGAGEPVMAVSVIAGVGGFSVFGVGRTACDVGGGVIAWFCRATAVVVCSSVIVSAPQAIARISSKLVIVAKHIALE